MMSALRKLFMGCVLVACVCLAASSWAVERSWILTGSGDWSDVNNWSGALVPASGDSALFANSFTSGAVVNADAGISAITVLRVNHPDNTAVRIFDGMLALDWCDFVRGRSELAGTVVSQSKSVMSVGGAAAQTAWLTLTGNAVLSATNRAAVYLGNADNALGRVTVRDQARLLLSTVNTDYGISVGRNSGSTGSFVQEGGLVRSVGRFMPGYSGYGIYELLGGTLDLPYGAVDTRYRLAVQANSTGLFHQRGGELFVATNAASITYHFEIGSGNNNAFGIYYADGGLSHFSSRIILLSGAGSNSNPSYGELTVDGRAVVEVNETVYLRSPSTTYANGESAINLNRGGTLQVRNLTRGLSGKSNLNGDGGVLAMANAGELATLFGTLSAVTLYEGGLELNHVAGSGGTRISGVLRGAGGWGVSGLTLSSGGSGYLAPPRVVLSGGSGSNATAVAFVDHLSGAVTGVVVTCRGEGYASGDTIALSFTGGGGSGAAGSATLTENRTGPLIKSGAARLVMFSQPVYDGEYVAREGLLLQSTDSDGAPNLSGVRVSGVNAVFQNGSGTAAGNTPDKWDLINPAATLRLGGYYGGGELLLPCGIDGEPFQQHYASWEWGFGRSRLTTSVNNAFNGAVLTLADGVRQPGAALTVTTITNLQVVASGDISGIAFGSVHPVVPGAVIGVTTDMITLDAGRLVALTAYDEGFGAESNLWLLSSAAAGGAAVNSLRMEDGVALTLEPSGTTVVGSGMVTARGGSVGGTRVTGGTLTSGNGVDLILYDFHSAIERRNVSNGKTGLIADTLITDNGATTVGLFALGRSWDPGAMSIAIGPVVGLTSTSNSYSGGTYIIDTALAVADDGSLGSVPVQPTNNIWTSGMAMLRAPAENVTVALHSNRNIRVCDGGLTFFGDDNAQAGRILFDVAGDISGAGVLVMNHWTGGGVRSIVQLRGDNRGFEGTVAVHGMLRTAESRSLPDRVNLLLCDRSDNTTGGGILEMNGVFNRAPGSGIGQVRWGQVNSVAPGYVSNNNDAYGGGFAAYGGPLSVNLGGDRQQLTLGVDGFAPVRLRLQNDYATDLLTWENPVDVTNATLQVQVAYNVASKTAVWRGAVTSSAASDGGFTKTGNGKLVLADGADFGAIAFTANNTVELQITNQQTLACNMSGSGLFLEKYGAGITLLSGSNTYVNATRIYEGTLCVNGTNTGGGTFTVWPGAVLGGSGTAAPKAGAAVTVNGTLAPGAGDAACGNLTIGSAAQPTVLNFNGVLALELDLTASDRVTLNGNLVIDSGAAMEVSALEESLWTARRGETITLLSWTGSVSGGDLSAVTVSALPLGWALKVDQSAQEVYLRYASPGTVIVVQ